MEVTGLPVTFLAYSVTQCVPLSPSCSFRQVRMSSRFHSAARAAAIAAMLMLPSQAFTQQSDDVDPEMRIQQLENQLRQLTGQNEELQYRNRQLEERLKALQGGAQAAPGQPAIAQPNVAAAPPVQQPGPAYRPPEAQPGYEPQIAAPAPIIQEAPTSAGPQNRRRGDAFDPSQNPSAP